MAPTFQEKLLALVSLTLVSTAIGFFMKVSGVKGKYNYSPMSAVCMTEAFKLFVSSAIIARLVHAQTVEKKSECTQEAEVFVKENYSWKVSLHNGGLSLAYAVVNLVTFGVFANAPASTFFLLKAASPVITALMLAVLVKRPISGQQWASILMQCVGLAATQIDPCSLSLSLTPIAYVYLIINIAVSCGAGVWNEHIVKTFNVSVNAQNSMMYSGGVAVNFLLFFLLPATMVGGKLDVGFFEGYNWTVMGVIAANGSVGLVITAVYKYADVVVKTFGLAGSTVTLFLLELVGILPSANSGPPRMTAVFGAVIVFYASYVYIAPPLMEAIPAAELANRGELSASAEEGAADKPVERVVPLGRNPRIFVMGMLLVAVGLMASFGAQSC